MGTNDTGILKTVNSGENWSLIFLQSDIDALQIDPANSSTIYAGTEGAGIFKSIDAGATWNAVNNGMTDDEVRGLATRESKSH